MAFNLLASWSGGKDSCYALLMALQQGHTLKAILNMMNEHGARSRSHGLPFGILQQQAAALGVPLMAVPTSWGDYEQHFIGALKSLKAAHGIGAAVFGDIDLQAHRDWEERVCATAGLEALLPLWLRPRRPLVLEMIAAGIRATIVSCNTQLGPDFLGRHLDTALVAQLEAAGVDACGENGEYHTLVTDCRLFQAPVKASFGEKQIHQDYWFIDVQ